ncbi:ABC transporter ATP-binding protein [Geotoga petraea]|jgi:ABC-2 type transport system ATP-binding protein|uniref:ABC transporter ATP-binding protein n=1 Tax=Geotoga petraea TaxID=28234 RepID=A0A4Z0VYH3_9BACT|nr:ABC transporter ATP-binding protein [Geotoga petraea]
MTLSKIEIKKISKRYDDVKALNKIDVNFDKGKIYGLIGRNGAGKTTLMKIIASQLIPTNGKVVIEGNEIGNNFTDFENICLVKDSFGKAFEEGTFMKLKTFFKIASKTYKNWDQEYFEYLCKKFDVKLNKYYSKLSRGMKTAVGLVLGLASRADITMFDEPYIGLDAVSREVFYAELQKDYMKHPRTIIISSHLIDELENIFEKVVFIDKGEIIINDDVENVTSNYYLLQGKEKDIEKHLLDFSVMHKEKLGSLASYAVKGEMNSEVKKKITSDNIDINKVSLQKILYYLTKGSEKNEK